MRYKLFLSSPSDVRPEREAATRVVNRINADLGGKIGFDLHRWEDDYYTADATFQDQIVKSSECDVVVCIFWKRLGSPLPPEFMRDDGTLPTGTEYEFELAMEQAVSSDPKFPDILAYRKRESVRFDEERVEAQMQQRAMVLAFWNKWFKNEQGHFVAGYHNFDDTADFEEKFEAHLRAWIQDRGTPLVWSQGSPFRGLAPFDMDHASVFFGRSRDVERARARLLANIAKDRPFLLVTGPSGSGKSSLIRAGVLPRLTHSGGAEGIPRLDLFAITSPALLREAGSGDWRRGLATVFFDVDTLGPALQTGDFATPDDLGTHLGRPGPAAAAPIRRALERLGPDQGVVLVLDQLEEIFGWDKEASIGIADAIETLCMHAPVAVVATMRSEFQHRLVELPAFERLCGLRAVAGPEEPVTVLEIGLPGRADLREMIVKPAAAAGLVYEGPREDLPGLEERIEAESGPGTLPAMQLLLSRLFERRDGQMMTHAAYDDEGGVQGVMARRADSVLGDLPRNVRDSLPSLARALLQSDASGGTVTSRRMARDRFAEGRPEQRLATALQDAGLLISEGNSLRLAHESLITGWQALQDIALEEAQNLATLNRVLAIYAGHRLAADGSLAGRDWLTGPLLAQATALKRRWGADALDAAEPGLAAFVARSAQRRLVRQGLYGGAAAAAAGITAVVYFAVTEISATRDLAQWVSVAEAELRDEAWPQAAAAAAEALELAQTPKTRSLALEAVLQAGSGHLIRRRTGTVKAFTIGADGALWTLGEDGGLTDVRGADRAASKQFPGEAPGTVGSAYFRLWALSDGAFVALRSHGEIEYIEPGAVEGHTIYTPATPIYPQGTGQADLVETATGFVLVVADGGDDGSVLTCDRGATTPACSEAALPEAAGAVAIAPDGRSVAVVSRMGVRLHDLAAPETSTAVSDMRDDARSLAWLVQGEAMVLVAGLTGGGLTILGTPGYSETAWRDAAIGGMANGAKTVTRLVAQPYGGMLAYDCAVERICITSLGPDGLTLEQVLYRSSGVVRDMAWTPDGNGLISAGWDGSLSEWTLATEVRGARLEVPVTGSISALAIDLERGRIWFGDAAGTLTWVDGATRRSFAADGWGEVKHLAIAPDGTVAAALASQTVLRITPDNRVQAESTDGLVERVGWLGDGITLVAPVGGVLRTWPERQEIVAPAPQTDGQGRRSTLGGVVAAPNGSGLIVSTSYGGLYRVAPGNTELVVPLDASADTHSALALDVSDDGRFLTATREDSRLLIYDIATGEIALELAVQQSNEEKTGTKVAAFSPDQTRVAVLTTTGRVVIWALAHDMSAGELLFDIDPSLTLGESSNAGKSVWIDWIDNTHFAVAHADLGVFVIDTHPDHLQDQLSATIGSLSTATEAP